MKTSASFISAREISSLPAGPGWWGLNGWGGQWSAAMTVKADLSSEVTGRLCEISVSAAFSTGGSRQARGPRLSSPLQKVPPLDLDSLLRAGKYDEGSSHCICINSSQ